MVDLERRLAKLESRLPPTDEESQAADETIVSEINQALLANGIDPVKLFGELAAEGA